MSLSLLLTCIATFQAPGEAKNMAFETKLKSVAVFRDGYGFFTREGRVKLEDGWATTNFVPNAIKGTVWIYTTDAGDRIDSVITTHDNKIAFGNPRELKTKLKDKIGLNLIFDLHSGQRFEGRLDRLLDDMLLVQVGAAYNAIPCGSIRSVSLAGYPIKFKVNTKNPNKSTTIGVAYLQDGIKWEPSYVLDLAGDKATLSLRASIQNTTESLNGTDLMFVVGSPFISNRGLGDMIALMPGQPLKIEAKDSKEVKEKDLDKEVLRSSPEVGEAQKPTPAAAISGEEAGELFFYKKPGMNLEPNDVAMVTVLDTKVAVHPSFEWNADSEEVLYNVNIENQTSQPLTSGPVFVLEDQHPIGQDTIKYTPAGGKASLHLARGIGLHVEKREAEVKRGNPTQIGKTAFIPVTLSGTLTITNFRKSDAELKITKTLRGKVESLGIGGKVINTQILNGEPNPVNDAEWKVTVPAGKTKTIEYTFVTYMSAEKAGSAPVPGTDGD